MDRKPTTRVARRTLLAGGTASALLSALPFGLRLRAQGNVRRKLILCYFSGGWDLLLGPDARDPARAYPGIELGTHLLAREYQTPFEVQIAGQRALWGAPMASLRAHADIATVIRGINMNTVSHPAGTAYILTGLAPAGSTPRGSSVGTVMVANAGLTGAPVLPNVAIGVSSYNQGLPPEASGVLFGKPDDLRYLLSPPDTHSIKGLEPALEQLHVASGCASGATAAHGLSLSHARLLRLLEQNLAQRFDFQAQSPEMQRLRTLYGIGGNSEPPLVAAAAAQALKTGMSQCVTIRIQRRLDTHTNWADEQPELLQQGFDALSALLTDLRETRDPTGVPLIDTTTVLAFSEFGRTPELNGADSRDHHFANAVLAFGAGFKPGVFGSTNLDDLGIIEVDLATGLPSPSGTILSPNHVMATLMASAGFDPSTYRADPIAALRAT